MVEKSHRLKVQTCVHLFSLALISFSMILYEIILTRIFAVLLSYHYVFAVLSLSMLGLGFGGVLLTRWFKHLSNTLFTVYTSLSVLLVTSIIFLVSQYSPASWGGTVTWIILFLPVVPFFFFGTTLASYFQKAPEKSSLLYGFDIAGGALAALFAVPLLDSIPAIKAVYLVAIILALSALILGLVHRIKFKIVAITLSTILLGGISASFVPGNLLPIKTELNKDINNALNPLSGKGKIVESRWSSFGQTDLVESTLFPGEKMIYIDGAAGTSMYNYRTLLDDTLIQADITTNFGEFFPFLFLERPEKDNALIIGPGGGRDILVALFGGVKSITAVEVNPDLVQIVRDYEDFNGGLYSKLPNVDLVVEEGRSFLTNTDNTYDLIMLALPVTKSSRSLNGYSLTENYLFTVEAFNTYLDRLTPEGRIIFVTHGAAELYRLLSLVLTAFEERGIPNEQAMNHLYTIAKHNMPTLVIRKKTFDAKDIQIRHATLHNMGFDQGAYFFPFQEQASFLLPLSEDTSSTILWRMFDQYFVDLSEGTKTLQDIVKEMPIDISAVHDDSPFFYNFDTGLPSPFRQLYALLVLGFVSIIILVSVKKVPKIIKSKSIRTFAQNQILKVYLLVFVFLGIGFMMLEVSFFQKLTLYLGNPVKATSVLLFSLLLGMGTGSFTSTFIKKQLFSTILITGVAIFLLSLGFSSILDQLMAFPISVPLKAGLLTGILGYFMGFPFPLAIRLMHKENLAQYTSVMWGANGLASVAGSIIAMIIGIEWGFTPALAFGGAMYLITSLLILLLIFKERKTI